MFAFNTVIFSTDLQGRVSDVDMMQVLIILATVFVVIIIAWLINYMVRFMLHSRIFIFRNFQEQRKSARM